NVTTIEKRVHAALSTDGIQYDHIRPSIGDDSDNSAQNNFIL
ncbi:hypothetical protein SNEBB_003525, partial [Seison nebaliae]